MVHRASHALEYRTPRSGFGCFHRSGNHGGKKIPQILRSVVRSFHNLHQRFDLLD